MKYINNVSGMRTLTIAGVLALALPLSTNFANAAMPNDAATPPTEHSQGRGPGMWMGGRGMGGGDNRGGQPGMVGMARPAAVGKVSAINGTTLTVVQAARPAFGSSTAATATTTFTVNASGATVYKNNATSTLSSIVTGDTVVVQGSISGTSISATVIRDGFYMMRPMGGMAGSSTSPFRRGNASSTSPFSAITGNGEPIVAGNITTINGSSITINNKSDASYTVDISSAKIIGSRGATTTASSLSVGDDVIVQGVINGSSITASSVIDQKGRMGETASSTANHKLQPQSQSIFAAIGGFFSHIFGF